MENALNGAAAAMNATRARDDKDYERAYTAWKDNTDLVIKRHNMMHTEYQDALTLLNTDMTLGEAKLKQLAAKFGDQQTLTLMEHGYYPQLFEMMQSRAKAIEGMTKAQESIDEYTFKKQTLDSDPDFQGQDPQKKYAAFKRIYLKTPLDEQFSDRWWADQNTPEAKAKHEGETPDQKLMRFGKEFGEYKRAQSPYGANAGLNQNRVLMERAIQIADDEKIPIEEALGRVKAVSSASSAKPSESVERAKFVQDKKAELKKEHPDWPASKVDEEALKAAQNVKSSAITGNRRQQIEAHIRQYDQSISHIDKNLDVLHKYAFAAGAPGYATRLGERVGNIFGSNKTDREQFMRDTEYLKLNASRLLLDASTGRPLSAEAAHVNNIVAGLGIGDTTANTIRALKDLKKLYEELKTGNQKDIGDVPAGSSELPAGSTPDKGSATPRWMSAPKVE
jgi:hypothetical protein